MAVSDWSTTASSNTTIDGINIAEGCPAGNINGAIRSVMANVRVFYNSFAALPSSMPVAGGTFTGDILRQSRGAYLHHASGSLTDGQIHVLAEGAPLPTGAEGRMVFYYEAP